MCLILTLFQLKPFPWGGLKGQVVHVDVPAMGDYLAYKTISLDIHFFKLLQLIFSQPV